MRKLRLKMWLLALDALAMAGLFGGELYGRVLGRASNAIDWGERSPDDDDDDEDWP